MNDTIGYVGAACFGLVVGYITYRTLMRSHTRGVSDLASVIAAIGGGTVTTLFDRRDTDMFGWYAIGLLIGFAAYAGLYWYVHGRKKFGDRMGDENVRPPTAPSGVALHPPGMSD